MCKWRPQGVLLELWRALLAELKAKYKIRRDLHFVDGTFVPAKKALRRLE